MKLFWWNKNNFGDMLSPVIAEAILGIKPEYTEKENSGKLLAIGSILANLKENDVVWGTGVFSLEKIKIPKGAKVLSVRGPITRSVLEPNDKVPEIYGDPALLLPLIYNPKVEKTHEVGLFPHYVDKNLVKPKKGEKLIDVFADWKTVVKEILSCKKIVASSLHGIICAEAYGIPAEWAVYSNNVIGGEIKFQDYFLGTGRERQKPFTEIPPIKNLAERQKAIIKALRGYCAQAGSSALNLKTLEKSALI